MEEKIRFIKLAQRWYVHLKDYYGSVDDLEMVMGADYLCELIDKEGNGFIDTVISNMPFESNVHNIHLSFIKSTVGYDDEVNGATYEALDMESLGINEVWLCNVVKEVFGGVYPADIYIKYQL